MMENQLKLFGAAPRLPEGFKYQPDLVTPPEEEALLPDLLRYSITFRSMRLSS